MAFVPIEQRDLVLREFGKDTGITVALAEFPFHFRNERGNALIVLMRVKRLEQVEFAVLLDLHAQIVQRLDGRVTSEKVFGAGSEGKYFQFFDAHDRAGDL